MHRLLLAACLLGSLPALAQTSHSSLFGDWREPGGSVIRIAPCGTAVCATLVAVSPRASSRFDVHNPNPSLRQHRLCGLVIGHDFHLTNTDHADNGTLYDPKTGKSYHGAMAASGDQLDLRGYIGLPLFGRSETWTRTHSVPPCSAA